ncbi:MAG TPA: Crp/Fnr family transcriptional regulator, partial [Accumulibacter sp.]|nr:Crp/Fnr family transcriptional regulator [Accumulibacter sp.]
MKLLEQIDLFAGLDNAQLDILYQRLRLRSYTANSIVVHEGDDGNGLFVIQSGYLKVFLTDQTGREVTLSLLDPGDYFGELALLDGAPRSASVMAVSRSELLHLPRASFLEMLEEQPACMQVVIRNLVARIRVLTDNVRSLALSDVYGRISRVFENLAVDKDGLRVIERRLTQQELANIIGASREMVNRILRDLVAGGYIEIDQHRMILR